MRERQPGDVTAGEASTVKLRVNFVLPMFSRVPIGGYRVVFEYADYLARRGHLVSVLFARSPDATSSSIRAISNQLWIARVRLLDRPLIRWHEPHPAVRHTLSGSLPTMRVPDADITIATAWQTAEYVARLPSSKGRKFYLIQHYESWAGDKEAVDATWRLPLQKIVIAKWLNDVARDLGVEPGVHITNGIDTNRFRVTRPIHERAMSVVSLYHREPFKGVPDALTALRQFHASRPSVPITMFGAIPRGPELPSWIGYRENPPQESLIENVYNRGAVYLGASLEEGWGLPPAEAMACGCTFVGTDTGGFREFARDGENSLLSPIGQPADLALNLLRLTDEPELRLKLQRHAVADMQQFTWDRSGQALEQFLLASC